MTDLERFFRQIVRNLAATDPARLRQPLPLNDLCESIVPYRANRRALQLESSEDYELVLMRLCAGEGGFVRTEPEELRAEFEAEIRSSNPDLDLVHRHENAVVSLEPEPLALALNPEKGLAFAPPGHSAKASTNEGAVATRSQRPKAAKAESPPARAPPLPRAFCVGGRSRQAGWSISAPIVVVARVLLAVPPARARPRPAGGTVSAAASCWGGSAGRFA